jgi:glycerophosphoryl diester phosphodiesterase
VSIAHWSVPAAIAHRGSRYFWPENTMTADGVLVCIHDATVDRTTDATGPVAALTFDELARLDAGFRHRGPDGHPFRAEGVTVPAFEELATSFPDARLIVDLKADGMTAELARVIERHHLADRIVVGSFSDRRIARFIADSGGRVATSTGPRATRGWVAASRVGRAASGPASALQVPIQMRGVRVVDRKLIEAAHRRGLAVHVWTVNLRSEMVELLDMGVDGIVTDRVDILREVLTERGRWTGG